MRQALRQPPDYLLLVFVALLVAIGLQAVYSATFGIALAQYDDVTYFLVRQSIWAGLGAVMLLACAAIDHAHWRRLSPWLLAAGVLALVGVLTPTFGISNYGAARWLQLSPLPPVQPSEFVKLALVLFLASWLAGREDRPKTILSDLAPFVALVGIIGLLIMRQPDMGTTLVIGMTAVAIFFLSGARLTHMAPLAAGGAVAGWLLIASSDYRLERLLSFLNFGANLQDADFHINQALIGIGSGGLFGRGLGASRQKFFYLPDMHTDSIFAIIAEELGFVGALLVIGLLGLVVWRGFKIATQSEDRFGYLVASGVSCWIAFQSIINIGGITKAIPLTGITLPFISSGGSSLAALMAAIGILLSISRTRAAAEPKSRPAHIGLGWRRS